MEIEKSIKVYVFEIVAILLLGFKVISWAVKHNLTSAIFISLAFAMIVVHMVFKVINTIKIRFCSISNKNNIGRNFK